MNIADEIRNIRRKTEKTQKEFAELLNIPQTTWASYEAGKANPPLKILIRLAEMGYPIKGLTTGAYQGIEPLGAAGAALYNSQNQKRMVAEPVSEYTRDLFKFTRGRTVPLVTDKTDINAMVLLPVYSQMAAAGTGQPETQLQELETYIPIVLEMLGGSNPRDCGIVRVVGDSMTDMGLLDGDLTVFDRTRITGDGVYVISIGTDVRIKHIEHRPIERKIVISSENMKRYPSPEIITYEQAENLLRIHGKVICWMHRHPY